MGAGLSATITTRIAQHLAAHDDKYSLSIGQWLLDKKLAAQEGVVRKLKNGKSELESICTQIGNCREGLQKADSRNSLMGHEGAAACAYFSALAKILPEKWKFCGRNRRPPRDPVNALFSLSYVIAGGEVRSLNLKHFTTNDQDGCLLNKKGRNVFFRAWAKWQEPSGENEKNIRSMAENFVRDLIAFFPQLNII